MRSWNDRNAWTTGFPIDVTRIAPFEDGAEIQWLDPVSSGGYTAELYRFIRPGTERIENLEEAAEPTLQKEPVMRLFTGANTSLRIAGLEGGRDWLFVIRAEDGRRSRCRLFRTAYTPGDCICYLHPDDDAYGFSGRYTCSPSVTRLPDGTLLVSHDVFEGRNGQNLSRIYASRDNGITWRHRADLYPCFWGSLFVHRGTLYMIATATEYGDLLIGCSRDGGTTWSPPSVLVKAGAYGPGGPHKAPMPVLHYRGRLWTGIDYGSWGLCGGHDTSAISAPEDADLLRLENWTFTPPLPFDESWTGRDPAQHRPSLLEGNMVAAPDGRIFNLPRFGSGGAVPNYGYSFLLEADPDHPGAQLHMYKKIAFPGNNTKFAVRRDPLSGSYYAFVNPVRNGGLSQRNILVMSRSEDLYGGFTEVCDLIDYASNGWPENEKQVGFQYSDWIFDGDDILLVSRTALNGAHNFHDANYITLHRIRNFRSL